MVEQASAVYAKSLFEVALSEKCETEILDNIKFLTEVLEKNPELLEMLKSPAIDISEKNAVIDKIFGDGFNRYVINFLKLLIEKKRIGKIDSIITAYEDEHNMYFNITEITVKTAVELSDALKEKLKLKLEKEMSKTVVLNCVVCEAIIGGIVLEYNGKQVDASTKTKLLNLKKEISKVIL